MNSNIPFKEFSKIGDKSNKKLHDLRSKLRNMEKTDINDSFTLPPPQLNKREWRR